MRHPGRCRLDSQPEAAGSPRQPAGRGPFERNNHRSGRPGQRHRPRRPGRGPDDGHAGDPPDQPDRPGRPVRPAGRLYYRPGEPQPHAGGGRLLRTQRIPARPRPAGNARHPQLAASSRRPPPAGYAQAVQRSAFPTAYDKWQQTATDWVAAITGSTDGVCPTGLLAGPPHPQRPTDRLRNQCDSRRRGCRERAADGDPRQTGPPPTRHPAPPTQAQARPTGFRPTESWTAAVAAARAARGITSHARRHRGSPTTSTWSSPRLDCQRPPPPR